MFDPELAEHSKTQLKRKETLKQAMNWYQDLSSSPSSNMYLLGFFG